jgi:hypothetical protein
LNKLFYLLVLLVCNNAFAYAPPIHFQVKKIVENHTPFNSASVLITTLKPAQDNQSVDEVLWQESIPYSSKTNWPILALLMEPKEDALMAAWKNFGLLAPSEQELLAHKPAQFKAMENSPRPFYRFNPQLSLKRFAGGIAYASENSQSGKAIYIERDTFLPISVSGACPSDLQKLSWAKRSSAICKIEFERGNQFKPGSSRAFRVILKNETQSLLIFRIDSAKINPGKSEATEQAPSDELQNIFNEFFR